MPVTARLGITAWKAAPRSMDMDIVEPRLDDYLDRLSRLDDPVLREMEERAARRNFPIVGPQVGRLLVLLTRLRKARRILELGSGFGYSAYWFARALGAGGEVILTEYDEDNLERAREYLGRGNFSCRFQFHQGDALELLDRLEGRFDIVFNDVDKHDYPKVFARAAERVEPGGLLITDNTLWSGRVLDGDPDRATRGVLEYTRLIFEHEDFHSLILPVRDGVAVSLRRG